MYSNTLIDGAFKSWGRDYYQIINIAVFYPKINSITPIFMIPTTGKSEYLYNYIINEIKNIYKNIRNNLEDFPKYIMMDFEKSLIKVIRNNFKHSKIDGCYFYFVKLLCTLAKKYELCQKEN